MQHMDINGQNDFGEDCHTEPSEPYFYDSAYLPVKRASPIPVEENEKCIVADPVVHGQI